MALNDPQWGRRGNDGPPDLDELLRRLNQKLNRFFGGNRGPRGPQGGNRPMGNGMLFLVILVILVWLASGFYIVNARERGIVLRFGKYVQPPTEPGPRWHWPYPIEKVIIVNMSEVRTVTIGYRNTARSKVLKESLMLTDDENIVDIQFAVQYTVMNPVDFVFENRNPEDAVMQAAETAIREVVGRSKMDFVLYQGKQNVMDETRKIMQRILDSYRTGISISQVTLQNTQPPEQVQAAFEDAVKASQDAERQKNEGQAYANDVIPRARGTASRLLQEAEGYRQRVLANAEGEANRFSQVLAEYSKAPAVTRDRLYLDTMQQVLSNATKIVVDQKSGSNLLYLPLDKLIQMSGAPTNQNSNSSEGSLKPTPEANATPDVTARTRDAFRSREREAR